MRSAIWKAMTLAVLTAGINSASPAQTASTAAPDSHLTAKSDPPPAPDKSATRAAATPSKPQLEPTVAEEIEILRSRIDQLENEVKTARAAALADSNDTSVSGGSATGCDIGVY